MFDYQYINEVPRFTECIFNDKDGNLISMMVDNRQVCFALYEFPISDEMKGYSMLANFIGTDEDKGTVWATGISSGNAAVKVFDSHKQTHQYYNMLKRRAPEGFNLIYEGNKNVG